MLTIPFGVKSGIPTRHRAFSPELLEAWTVYQFRGWLVRKGNLERGGLDHHDRKALATIPESTLVFIRNLAPGLLDIFRFQGQELVQEMRESGLRINDSGLAAPAGGLPNPIEGLPLADGTMIKFDRELLLDLAYSRHHHWMAVREQSWLTPYQELWQDKNHKAHKRFNRAAPDSSWDGDIVSIYGDCYALAHLSDDEFEALYAAASPTRLNLKVYGEAFSSEFRSSWPEHFLTYADGWRRIVAGELVSTKQVAAEQRQLALDRSEAVLDCLRLYGVNAVTHLREVGNELLTGGVNRDTIEGLDPIAGLTLNDGGLARIDSELISDLGEEHRLLYRSILGSYQLHPVRRVRELCTKSVSESLVRDQTRIYGFAVALAFATLPENFWAEIVNGCI